MVNRSFSLTCWLLVGLLLVETVGAAVTSVLDRNVISINQTVRLQLSTDQDNADQPDLTVLDKDFIRLGTSSSQNLQIINGAQSSNRQWTIELEPRTQGVFTVPAIQIGTQQSQPLQLKVVAAAAAGAPNSRVFMEIEVDQRSPYVQQQVIVTLRLLLGIDLNQGNLEEPQINNAIVQRLGDDAQYDTVRNGQRWRVIERRYAVFPQLSGKLEFPAVRFEGYSNSSDNRSNRIFGQFFNRGQRLRAHSEAMILEIKPPPPEFDGSVWLPAKEIKLSENQLPGDSLTVGEPFTRTIQIEAVGLSAEQLPEIELNISAGVKSYADKPQATSSTVDGDVQATKALQTALVPTAAGDLILPAVRLPWWNTVLNRAEVAELPPLKLTVLSAPVSQTENIQPLEAPPTASRLNTMSDADLQPGSDNHKTTPMTDWLWPMLATVFALLWLLTLWLFYRRMRNGPTIATKQQDQDKELSMRTTLRQLERACSNHDAAAARSSLLAWAAACWPLDPPTTLDQISLRLDDSETTTILNQLDQSLYAATNNSWSGQQLQQLCGAILKRYRAGGTVEQTQPLPPLYPES